MRAFHTLKRRLALLGVFLSLLIGSTVHAAEIRVVTSGGDHANFCGMDRRADQQRKKHAQQGQSALQSVEGAHACLL